MVETEIIPRLLLAHRSDPVAPQATNPKTELGSETIESFARMALSQDLDALIAFVSDLLQSGLSMEVIYADLLAPAARRLGACWDEDSASFTDVTVGLGRLRQLVRALDWTTPYNGDAESSARSVFFASQPGEQRTFSLFLTEEFFRWAGWRTWTEPSSAQDAMISAVRGRWFDAFYLNVNRDTPVDKITSAVSAVRRASRNPALFVLVSGRLFMGRPELVSAVGADATASNGGDGLLIADKAVRRLAFAA